MALNLTPFAGIAFLWFIGVVRGPAQKQVADLVAAGHVDRAVSFVGVIDPKSR
jgi:hypothetical protein